MTEREQLPRTLGYGHLEAGVSTSGMEVATSADLLAAAAAAAVAGPSVRGTPCSRCTLRSPWSALLLTGTLTVAPQTMMAIW